MQADLVGGRRVVVTGTSPVPAAIAGALAVAGGRVVTVDRPGAPTVEGAVAHVDCAFGSEDDVVAAVAAAADALGGVDQFVHAWIAPELVEPQPFDGITEDRWADACEGSLAAAWWLTRQAIAPLRAAGGGSIVYVVPTVGLSGAAGYTMLATVAEGVRVLGKGCARHWGKDGVAVNVVAVNPELMIPAARDGSLHRAISLAVPALGGPGDTARDLAPLVAVLGLPETRFLTTATAVADGGVWVGL